MNKWINKMPAEGFRTIQQMVFKPMNSSVLHIVSFGTGGAFIRSNRSETGLMPRVHVPASRLVLTLGARASRPLGGLRKGPMTRPGRRDARAPRAVTRASLIGNHA